MKSTIFGLLFTVLFSSCNYYTDSMPKKDEVKASKELQIDGEYEMSTNIERGLKKVLGIIDIGRQKVRFEKGRAFYEDMGKLWNSPNIEPGKVFIKDIRMVTQTRYKGTFYPLRKDTTFNVSILVEGNDLKINVQTPGAIKVDQTINFELIK